MKTLKKILIALLGIIALIMVIALFLPSKIRVERSTTINAPMDSVFEQVNNLKNWEKWSPWNMMDPNRKMEYFGPERGTGSGYKWDSENKNVGKGAMTIASSSPNDSIFTDLEFEGRGKAGGGFKFTKEDAGVKVTWYMLSDAGMNPVKRIFGQMMDKMLGPQFEKGLANLKNVSENTPATTTTAVPVATDSTAANPAK